MEKRELRIALAIALIGAPLYWLVHLLNACSKFKSVFSKGSCTAAFEWSLGSGAFWLYNILAVSSALVAIYFFRTIPPATRLNTNSISDGAAPLSREASPENFSSTQSRREVQKVVNDLSSANYKIFLIEKYSIRKVDVLDQYVCNDKLFDTVDAALLHAHEAENGAHS